jgi:hypothetical protein
MTTDAEVVATAAEHSDILDVSCHSRFRRLRDLLDAMLCSLSRIVPRSRGSFRCPRMMTLLSAPSSSKGCRRVGSADVLSLCSSRCCVEQAQVVHCMRALAGADPEVLTVEAVEVALAQFGEPIYTSMPRDRAKQIFRGFMVVEFKTVEGAQK